MSKSNIWYKPSDDERNKDKAQTVAYLVYPDSVNNDWIGYLNDSGLRCVVSPLHKNDISENGTLIKPHYHLIVKYNTSVSWYAFDEIRKNINAYEHFEKIKSTQNIINYLTHDSYTSVDKVKYSKDDIQYINCCEMDFVNDQYIRVIEFIETNNICSFRSLINQLMAMGYEGRKLIEWIIPNSYFVISLVKSRSSWLTS